MPKPIAILAQDTSSFHQGVASYFGNRATTVNNLSALSQLLASSKDATVIVFPRYNPNKAGILSGYSAASQLRASGFQNAKIIVLSNELGIGEREKARYAGIDEVLVVPFDPQDLEALL